MVYAENALSQLDLGLNPIPVGPDKRPLFPWGAFQDHRIPRHRVEYLRRVHADAGIGTTTGGITRLFVVDVDDANLVDEAVARFGDTPVKVLTPRGGFHLYYRGNGDEPTITCLDGELIDIRARGGLIITPPTERRDTAYGRYDFVEGSWDKFADLPAPAEVPVRAPPDRAVVRDRDPATIVQGERNTALFDHLRSVGGDCQTEPALCGLALAFNGRMPEPLAAADVTRTAASVWRMKEQGRLLRPGDQGVMIREPLLSRALDEPDAVALYLLLKRSHSDRTTFAIAPEAMAKAYHCDKRRIAKARAKLIGLGLLREVHHGGLNQGASQFSWG